MIEVLHRPTNNYVQRAKGKLSEVVQVILIEQLTVNAVLLVGSLGGK